MRHFNTLLKALNTSALAICAFAILSIALIGALDVIMTLLLGRPITGAYELTETLMVMVVFLALGYLHQERAYIAVDALYECFGFTAQRIADYFSLLLIVVLFSMMAWRAWIMALRSWRIGEYSVGLIPFPIYPSRFAFAIGCSLLLVCCIADLGKGKNLRMRGNAGLGVD